MVRTTLDVDPKLLEDVLKATGQKSKSKAVNKALEDYIRRIKIAELRAMAGKIDIEDNWRELEELELKRQRKLQW